MRVGRNGYTHGATVVEALNPWPSFPPVFLAVDGRIAGVARTGDGEHWTVEVNGEKYETYCDCTARALLPSVLKAVGDGISDGERPRVILG